MINSKLNKGLTLIELLIVMAIIIILTILGFRSFNHFKSKAICAEAKYVLMNIYTLELSYYASEDIYGGLDDIGFKDKPNYRYTYSILNPNPVSFTAQAVLDHDHDNDSNFDTWTINQRKHLVHTIME